MLVVSPSRSPACGFGMQRISSSIDCMDIMQAIKSAVPLIVRNFGTNENSKKVLNDLMTEVSASKLQVERLFLMYHLMDQLSILPEADTVTFFAKVLPTPLSPNVSLFVEQMVSLAVSLEKREILTAAAVYLQREEIRFPFELESLPEDLATQSPQFVAVVISKGCFTASPAVFPPQLLTKWLHDLIDSEVPVSIDAQRIIEYSLIGKGADDAPLHLAILKCMQKNKVQPIPPQFVISAGSSVVACSGTQSGAIADKFSQILLVALECKLLAKFTNQMRKQLLDIFADNELIALILRAVV